MRVLGVLLAMVIGFAPASVAQQPFYPVFEGIVAPHSGESAVASHFGAAVAIFGVES
jgi:hypothetical protein